MSKGKIVALSGGVGGAKLGLGLSHVVDADRLTIIVNTGDDFEYLGFPISPDIDTLIYTLAGLSDPKQGWGLAGESWHFKDGLEKLGQETWFALGDKDLATHVRRRFLLEQGVSLSQVTQELSVRLGVPVNIAPMSDDPVHTMIKTAQGDLSFQDYFVRLQCTPKVTGFYFDGAEQAQPSPAFCKALEDPDLCGVVLCPSNPFVSIDPILAVQGVRSALQKLDVPIIAVCPIVGGKALKGPSAKMMEELGLSRSPAAIAAHYEGLLDGFVIDEVDGVSAAPLAANGLQLHVCQTVMKSLEDRITLAEECVAFLKTFR